MTTCKICKEEFEPNRPWREICYKESCRKRRDADTMKKWRDANPSKVKPTTLQDKERHGKEFENAKKRNMFLSPKKVD